MTPTPLQLTAICASLARQGFHVERPESELMIGNEWLGKMLRLACAEAGRLSTVFEPHSTDIMDSIASKYLAGDAEVKARIDEACGGSFSEFARHAEPQHWEELETKLGLKSE